jgi:hypothetical protein
MTRTVRIRLLVLVAVAVAIAAPVVAYGRDSGGPGRTHSVEAITSFGTAFTFQGRLGDAGSPANGAYDFTFYLYDSASGGSQVGPAQVLGDVPVAAGLFTVTLDFGNVFHGGQYYLEIQVRPGVSSGVYTILTPREPVTGVPNAMYAFEAGSTVALQGINVSSSLPNPGDVLKYDGVGWVPAPAGAGGLSLPFTAAQGSASALFTITNSNAASANASAIVGETASTASGATAIVGRITSSSPGAVSAAVRGTNNGTGANGIGVAGTQAGSGWGVFGSAPSGLGVFGTSTSGTGGYFSSTTGSAIDVAGKIKVSGSAPAAFEWLATGGNISGTETIITNPATDGNANAILIVTPLLGVSNPHVFGVYWDLSKWRIKNTDGAPMVSGARFNILVINQ